MKPCFFCGMPMAQPSRTTSVIHCSCIRCGHFGITTTADAGLIDPSQFTPEQSANISGYIRENQNLTIEYSDLDFLQRLRTPTVAEKAMKGLAELAKQYPIPGSRIIIEWTSLEGEMLKIRAMLEDGAFNKDQIS